MRSSISTAEHEERIKEARSIALAEGLDGLLVWGRGGGSHDGYGELFYLSGVYVDFPLLADFGQQWSDRAFAAMLVTPEVSELFVFPSELPAEAPTWLSLREAPALAEAMAERLRKLSMADSKLGLVGGRNMTWKQATALEELLPELELIDGDNLIAPLRARKSPAELELLRQGARLSRSVVERVLNAARPGDRTEELDADVISEVIAAGASVSNIYTDAYSSDSASSPGVLGRGDQVTMDLTGTIDGYFFDVCRTATIGADPSPEAMQLHELARRTVDAVSARLTPGSVVAEAAAAGFDTLDSAGYDWRKDEFTALGHGLGLGFEPPWIHPDDRTVLVPGMVLAIERYCSGWGTCGAHEDVYVVTGRGPEVLADLTAEEVKKILPPDPSRGSA